MLITTSFDEKKMLELGEKLIAVEDERLAGRVRVFADKIY